MRTRIIFLGGFCLCFSLKCAGRRISSLRPADTNGTNQQIPSQLNNTSEAAIIDTAGKSKEEERAFNGLYTKVKSVLRDLPTEVAWLRMDLVKALEVVPALEKEETVETSAVYREWLYRAAALVGTNDIPLTTIIQSLKTKIAKGETEGLYHWLVKHERLAKDELTALIRSNCGAETYTKWITSAQRGEDLDRLLAESATTSNIATLHAQFLRVVGLRKFVDALLVDMASLPATSSVAYGRWQAEFKHPGEIFKSLDLGNEFVDTQMLPRWLEYVQWYRQTLPLSDKYLLHLLTKGKSLVEVVEMSAIIRQSTEIMDVPNKLLNRVFTTSTRSEKVLDDWLQSSMGPEKALIYLHLDDKSKRNTEHFILWLKYVHRYVRYEDGNYGDLLNLLTISTTEISLFRELYMFRQHPSVAKSTEVKLVIDDLLIYTLFASKWSNWRDGLVHLKGSGTLFIDKKFIQLFKSRNAPEEMTPLYVWLQTQEKLASSQLEAMPITAVGELNVGKVSSSKLSFDDKFKEFLQQRLPSIQFRCVKGIKGLANELLLDIASNPVARYDLYKVWQIGKKHPAEIFGLLHLREKGEDAVMIEQWVKYMHWYRLEVEPFIEDDVFRLLTEGVSLLETMKLTVALRQCPGMESITERMLDRVVLSPVLSKHFIGVCLVNEVQPTIILRFLHLDGIKGKIDRFSVLLNYVALYLRGRDGMERQNAFSYNDLLSQLMKSSSSTALAEELEQFRYGSNSQSAEVERVVEDMLIYLAVQSPSTNRLPGVIRLEGSGWLFTDVKFNQLVKSKTSLEEIMPLYKWLANKLNLATKHLLSLPYSALSKHGILDWQKTGLRTSKLFRSLNVFEKDTKERPELISQFNRVASLRKLKDEMLTKVLQVPLLPATRKQLFEVWRDSEMHPAVIFESLRLNEKLGNNPDFNMWVEYLDDFKTFSDVGVFRLLTNEKSKDEVDAVLAQLKQSPPVGNFFDRMVSLKAENNRRSNHLPARDHE